MEGASFHCLNDHISLFLLIGEYCWQYWSEKFLLVLSIGINYFIAVTDKSTLEEKGLLCFTFLGEMTYNL